MRELSKRTVVILLAIIAFVHFGTPLLADLFFELYHLTGIEALYALYGGVRYASAQFMFWDNRWMVTILVTVLLFGLALLRNRWRSSKEGSA